MKYITLLSSFLCFFNGFTLAQTHYVSTGTGVWTNAFSSTGTGGTVTYEILAGDTVTCNVNSTPPIDSIIIAGVLQFGNGKKLDLASSGIIVIESGGKVGGGSAGSAFRFNGATGPAGSFNVTGPAYAAGGATAFTSGSPLPVNWLQTEVQENEHGLEVKWSTASEQNNSHFILEMGTSPSSLQAVETIYSKANGGNSNQVLDYKLQLAMPPSLAKAQTIYFRLEQVDHDGASDHSGIFKIERDLKHRYSVFTDGRTIRIVSAESERLNAELYLLSGGEVEKASSNTNELMLRPENRGLYLLVIRDQDTLIGMEKILLE